LFVFHCILLCVYIALFFFLFIILRVRLLVVFNKESL